MHRHKEARDRANQTLRLFCPEPSTPIDVEFLARSLGFDILPFDFPDSTAGLTFIEGDLKVIGVNKFQARVRQRFSIAHEIGHYLLGHIAYDDGGTHLDEPVPSYLDPQRRQEQEANEFAAELLMPHEFLLLDVKRFGVNGAVLAHHYEVSEQAMWIQLLDHQLATRDF